VLALLLLAASVSAVCDYKTSAKCKADTNCVWRQDKCVVFTTPCTATCGSLCAANQFCDNYICQVPDSHAVPAGGDCSSLDCQAGLSCISGTCNYPCCSTFKTAAKCGAASNCSWRDKKCVDATSSCTATCGSECAANEYCDNFLCQVPDSHAVGPGGDCSSLDCQAGLSCISGTCNYPCCNTFKTAAKCAAASNCAWRKNGCVDSTSSCTATCGSECAANEYCDNFLCQVPDSHAVPAGGDCSSLDCQAGLSCISGTCNYPCCNTEKTSAKCKANPNCMWTKNKCVIKPA